MNKIYDVTVTITPELPTWPGDPGVVLERVNKIEEGANANVSHLDIGVHTGTHVDAPVHFLPGEKGIESLDLEVLIGPALVVEIPEDAGQLTADVLAASGLDGDVKRVLFKTRNSRYWQEQSKEFHTDFIGITADGAEFLVKQGVKLVGIDYLSVAPYKKSRPTHEILLRAGVIALEGVDLSQVSPGTYQLYCLPLKLGGSDGAPARVVLLEA
ncbi:MAG: cyclase family protein [Chloroflexi bacterium]|nr:cyclase family protein [Anaerolineaceae bacterium]NMB86937.1 cyclase family protein [Chloroflexota bacterium]